MRSAAILLTVTALILAAAWNANEMIDAWIGLYSYPQTRQLLAWTLCLIAAGMAVAALILISRSAHRVVERDFPNTWKE